MRAGKRMRQRALFYAIILFVIPLIAPAVSAGECCYGSVHAWFQGSNGQWENATAHPVLLPGEVFHIKIRVSLSTKCQVFFLKLHEFGTPVFEVLAGPSRFEELLEHRVTMNENQQYTYRWTVRVRPQTTWTYGNAPLEVFAQLNRNDFEECCIDFDVLVASILPLVQTDSEAHDVRKDTSSDSAFGEERMGFQLEVTFIAVAVFYIVLYLKKRWHGKG